MNLHKLIATENECYKVGQKITPKGIMVHSTGANNPNLRRYTLALSRAAIGAASFNVTAGIRNAGGYGLINTNLWAIAEKK